VRTGYSDRLKSVHHFGRGDFLHFLFVMGETDGQINITSRRPRPQIFLIHQLCADYIVIMMIE